jgi:hypothetical protein
MASILYEVAEGKASQKQKNILLYRTIKKDWADGFAAPGGQRCALTTGDWTSYACPQLHKPQQHGGSNKNLSRTENRGQVCCMKLAKAEGISSRNFL